MSVYTTKEAAEIIKSSENYVRDLLKGERVKRVQNRKHMESDLRGVGGMDT